MGQRGLAVTRAALLLALVACGNSPKISDSSPILPPNVAEACAKAEQCGIVMHEQIDPCLRCVEKLAGMYEEAVHGPIPPLADVPCDVLAKFAHDTLVSECVVRRSFGP
jgi:hypothetical protein